MHTRVLRGEGGAARRWALVSGMLVTGVCNSIICKWQDMQCVEGCGPGERAVTFSQPVWQTLQMFVGELLCIVPLCVGARRRAPEHAPEHAPLLARRALDVRTAVSFAVPAMCDILATTLMNVALLLMPVSIYQMTRGVLVLWVGLFSVLLLHYRLRVDQWLSLALVVAGVGVVGLSSVVSAPDTHAHSAVSTIAGLAVIPLAQMFAALQFVAEERIMAEHDVEPVAVVALEGLFGTAIVLVLMPVLHWTVGRTPAGRGGVFDVVAGFRQIVGSPAVMQGMVLLAVSVSLYNMLGLHVTRVVSATARSTLDTSRSLGVWAVSVALGWEALEPLGTSVQIAGFALLVYGTSVFNGIVAPARWMTCWGD